VSVERRLAQQHSPGSHGAGALQKPTAGQPFGRDVLATHVYSFEGRLFLEG
jgi:hypothetical protein